MRFRLGWRKDFAPRVMTLSTFATLDFRPRPMRRSLISPPANRALWSLKDTDFGTLLSLRDTAKPSVILFRHMPDRSASGLLSILLRNIATVEVDLESGAMVVIEPGRIRVRRLPMENREP